MKVLQVIDSLPETSGGSRFVVNLSKSLKNRGIHVEVMLIKKDKNHFIDELIFNNIPIIDIGANSNISRFKPGNIFKISKYLSDYDVVHVHIFPASYLVALASYFNNKKVPIVFTEHNAFNRRAVHKLFVYIEKFIYSRFNKIIGITPEVITFINKYITKEKHRLVSITNGVDLESLNKTIIAKRSDFNLKDNEVICLMAARFSYQKDHETLIKSFVNLPDNFKLLLAGDGENLNKCMMLVEQLNLKDKVIFIGSRKDIYSIIKMSDINILSSRYEGFGLSIVEAMALGKPVIASNVEGMSNVIKNAGLLFEVGNSNQLYKYILNLGTNNDLYQEITLKCKIRANDFSLNIMTSKYINVYKELSYEK